jgi:hypothetical protein
VAWVALYVGLAVAGLVVLTVLAVRLWRQVREFGQAVSAASERIAAVADELAKISPPSR